ncbi:MAG: hypothetical protein ABEJ56_06470 [Candidatus Nanohaloarchaea archaeon]
MERRLGKCIFCNQRVKTDQTYLTVAEGYAHRSCLSRTGIMA